MNAQPIPFRRRPLDIIIVLFFLINVLFVTYIVDAEQLIIPDPSTFTYPAWPPPAFVDAIHWYGRNIDPLLMARPIWWKMTILIDNVLFGPFYICAIYAFIKGKNWIRIPSFLYSAMLFTNVVIILGEERFGPYATPRFPLVFLLNLPWLVFPIIITIRMSRSPNPFAYPIAHGQTHRQSILERNWEIQ